MSIMHFASVISATDAGPAASLDSRGVADVALFPGTATTYYRISTDGNVYGGPGLSLLEAWRDRGSNPDFEILFTLTSGTAPALTNITLGAWMDIDNIKTLTLSTSGLGNVQAVLSVSIRNKSTGTVLTTATITMDVEVVA